MKVQRIFEILNAGKIVINKFEGHRRRMIGK